MLLPLVVQLVVTITMPFFESMVTVNHPVRDLVRSFVDVSDLVLVRDLVSGSS